MCCNGKNGIRLMIHKYFIEIKEIEASKTDDLGSYIDIINNKRNNN